MRLLHGPSLLLPYCPCCTRACVQHSQFARNGVCCRRRPAACPSSPAGPFCAWLRRDHWLLPHSTPRRC